MGRWLEQFSKTTLALTAIALGVLLLVLFDPPHTVCDAQKEVFNDGQKSFLFLNPKNKLQKKTKYQQMIEQCKMTNTPGGCYELFMDIKRMLADLKNVPRDCGATVSSQPELKAAIWQTAELMVQLAWGSKPPTSYYEKFAWLDPADMALFCSLKEAAERVYGIEQWTQFRERMFTLLPGAKELPRAQVWENMILSVNCSRYQ